MSCKIIPQIPCQMKNLKHKVRQCLFPINPKSKRETQRRNGILKVWLHWRWWTNKATDSQTIPNTRERPLPWIINDHQQKVFFSGLPEHIEFADCFIYSFISRDWFLSDCAILANRYGWVRLSWGIWWINEYWITWRWAYDMELIILLLSFILCLCSLFYYYPSYILMYSNPANYLPTEGNKNHSGFVFCLFSSCLIEKSIDVRRNKVRRIHRYTRKHLIKFWWIIFQLRSSLQRTCLACTDTGRPWGLVSPP